MTEAAGRNRRGPELSTDIFEVHPLPQVRSSVLSAPLCRASTTATDSYFSSVVTIFESVENLR